MIIDSNGNVGIGSSPLTVYRDFGAVSVVNPATVPLFVSSQDDSFVTVYTSNETNNSGIAFARWETPANKAVEKWRIYNKGTTGSATDDALYILSQDGNGLILSQGDISSFSGNELRLNARLSQGLSSSYPAYGFYLFTGISGAPTMTGTDQVGMFVDMHGSSEATSQVIGSQFRAGTTNAAFNTALAISVKAMNPEKGSGSTITKAVGLRIDSITAGETNYAIETLGTAPSVFGGNVGIGTTNPKSRLHLEGGDITLSTEGSGIILKSTNGPCFKVTVNESGTLITTPLESC